MLEDNYRNITKNVISAQVGEKGLEIDFFIVQAELVPDAVSADIDRTRRNIKESGYFFCGLSRLDQVGYLQFPCSEVQMAG